MVKKDTDTIYASWWAEKRLWQRVAFHFPFSRQSSAALVVQHQMIAESDTLAGVLALPLQLPAAISAAISAAIAAATIVAVVAAHTH
jgi:hypothetical protein